MIVNEEDIIIWFLDYYYHFEMLSFSFWVINYNLNKVVSG